MALSSPVGVFPCRWVGVRPASHRCIGSPGSRSGARAFARSHLVRRRYRRHGDGDPARGGTAGGRGRVRAPRGAPPARAARALLPDARLAARRRGRLQDALLRAWRGLPRFEGRSSLRSWLYRIATNTSPGRDRRAPSACCRSTTGPRRTRTTVRASRSWSRSGSSPTPTSSSGSRTATPRPTPATRQRESVELAFVAALQHLPATQRAVLILREVLGFSAREVAEALDTTVASVNSALQRARKTVEDAARESQQATLRALGDRSGGGARRPLHGGAGERRRRRGRRHARRGRRVVDAAGRHLVPRRAVADFLRLGPLSGAWRWRHLPARVNGQAAVGIYSWDEARARTCRSRSTS